MTILVCLLLGILCGFLIGLIPGISVSFVIILSLPFLGHLDVLSILTFYLAVLSSSQYSETIVALILGVPGESTSLPTVQLRNQIPRQDVTQALYNCATGSLIGSMLAVVITLPAFYFLKDTTFYLKTWFLLFVAAVGMILAVTSSRNKWYQTAALMIFGWLLAKVGYDSNTGNNFLTFDNVYLYGGIPTIAVLLSLYVLPNILMIKDTAKQDFNYQKNSVSIVKIPLAASVRGTVIGYLTGLIPYVGSIMSSNISYFVERKLKSPAMAQLTAAETANNAAFFSVVVPLLIFGVAIVPSEAMLLEVMARNTIKFNWAVVEKIIVSLTLIMVAINAINWIINTRAITLTLKLSNIPAVWIKMFGLSAAAVGLVYLGQEINQAYYYIVIALLLTPIGYLLRGKDMLPLIFAFLLQSEVESAIIRIWSMIT